MAENGRPGPEGQDEGRESGSGVQVPEQVLDAEAAGRGLRFEVGGRASPGPDRTLPTGQGGGPEGYRGKSSPPTWRRGSEEVELKHGPPWAGWGGPSGGCTGRNVTLATVPKRPIPRRT